MRVLGFLCAVLLCLPGCAGYHIGPVKPAAMSQVRTLAVPCFKNNTLEPRMEVLVANALIRQLQQDGTYKITSERDADATVEGLIERIERVPARGGRKDGNTPADFYQTSEFTLNLVLRVKAVEKNSGKTLLSKNFSGTSSFFVSIANPTTPKIFDTTPPLKKKYDRWARRTADVNRDEHQALPQAVEDAAVQITSYLSEGW